MRRIAAISCCISSRLSPADGSSSMQEFRLADQRARDLQDAPLPGGQGARGQVASQAELAGDAFREAPDLGASRRARAAAEQVLESCRCA